jgi:[ribosomal protein S18]-alanine N-acetyltransferase
VDELVIESMEMTHVADVLRIERDLFPAPWTEGMIVQEVEEKWLSRSFIATIGGQVVGYIIAWLLRGEMHILNLAVAATYQRRGIGRRLLDHALDLAKSEHVRLVTLEVRASNEPAKQLYARMGFVPVGVRRRYYHDNSEDAIVMTRRFEGPR